MDNGKQADVAVALRHLEALIERLDQVEDPSARETARELVELILDLHGVALARLMSVVAGSDRSGALISRLSEDDQVRPLLLLHGLHPETVETRVRRAAERLTPHLGVHGLRLEVRQISDGKARLRVTSSEGATIKASVLWTLPMEIEGAIVEAAPDIEEVVIEGLDAIGPTMAAPASN